MPPHGLDRTRVVEFSYRPIRTMAFFCRVRAPRVIGQFIRGRTRQKKAIVRRSGDTVGGSDDVSNMTVWEVELSVGRPPDPTWKRPPGRPRTKWTDQLRRDNYNVPIATL